MDFGKFWGGAAAPYQIDNSLRFRQGQYLTRTMGCDATTTLSVWIKRGKLDNTFGIFGMRQSGTNNYRQLFLEGPGYESIGGDNTGSQYAYSNNKLRDVSAWYHIVYSCGASRTRLFINGVECSYRLDVRGSSASLSNTTCYIGTLWNGTYFFDGHMAEMHFLDGYQLDPDNFGEYDDNGVWRPIEVSGLTYGTNGFYLKFDPSATNGIGHDHSGNGNNFTPTSFVTSGTGTDVMSDTPTNNFATLNPLEPASASAGTLSDGNLYISNQDYSLQKATFRFGDGGPTTGKYYWEVTHTGGNYTSYVGVTSNLTQDAGEIVGGGDKSFFGANYTRKYDTTSGSYTHTYSSGDVHGYAIDLDAQEIKYYINGTLKFTDSTLPDPATTVLVPFQFTTNSGGVGWTNTSWNFGQRAFSYQPTGYSSLCTANLPAPDIANGSEYFNVVTYTGDGQSSKAITGVGFQPNFSVIKNRSNSNPHIWQDSVRGVTASNGNQLVSSNTFVENDNGNGHVGSYDSDGFTVEDGTSTNYPRQSTNYNNHNYVAWLWKAGTASGSSNTDGSITSTVSANPTAGFSIVTFSASLDGTTSNSATIGHGLGVAPAMIILKVRDYTHNWQIYHQSMGTGNAMQFDTAAKDSASGYFPSVTATTFIMGDQVYTGGGTRNYVAYCFAEVEGYSKIGVYSSNNNSDGPFVHTGFTPALVVIKSLDGHGGWMVYDTARMEFNPGGDNNTAYPVSWDRTYAESAFWNAYQFDILSNGFKLRSTQGDVNYSGDYVFMALAENPFGGSGVSPATAR